MAETASPLGSDLLLVAWSAAALEEIRGRSTHRQSTSNPYDHGRFTNFVVPYASEPYLTKSEVRLRMPKPLVKPVNRPVERCSKRRMRRIQVQQHDAVGHAIGAGLSEYDLQLLGDAE